MTLRGIGAGAVLLLACTTASGGPSGPPREELAPLHRSELVVESGHLGPARSGGWLELDAPVVRAVVGDEPRSGIELEFVYRGPTAEARPLASGELRTQIGVKLRARDTCNVVYVMWHVAPTHGLHVSVKSNPGQALHAQCGDRGYVQVQPRRHSAVPAVRPGETHRLQARIDGDTLSVTVDGAPAWEGPLPPAALAFDGPVGIRSDNGNFSLRIRVPRR